MLSLHPHLFRDGFCLEIYKPPALYRLGTEEQSWHNRTRNRALCGQGFPSPTPLPGDGEIFPSGLTYRMHSLKLGGGRGGGAGKRQNLNPHRRGAPDTCTFFRAHVTRWDGDGAGGERGELGSSHSSPACLSQTWSRGSFE